ncbi:MAG: DUF3343 domain-containing protein [Lachnospirales bacterium]
MEKEINYYVLFENHTHGMILQKLLREGNVPSRIAPAPRCTHSTLGCGIALLIKEEHIKEAKEVIHKSKANFIEIIALENEINPFRDRFC